MVDSTKRSNTDLSETDRNQLLNRIDELEKILAKKKAESQQQAQDNTNSTKLKIGTDGIPVLVETISDDKLNEDEEIINSIIDKIDKEITQDLDELIVMLKDSIIDEVKMRLLKELHLNKDK